MISKLWHKLTLILLLLIVPVAVLGYLAISAQIVKLDTEKKRLAALEYVNKIRQLLEVVEKHRTASIAFLAGDRSFEPALMVHSDDIQDQIEALDFFEIRRWGGDLQIEEWADVQDHWAYLKAYHMTGKPEQSDEWHDRLLKALLSLLDKTADRSSLSFVADGTRYYLHDILVSRLPIEIEVLGQVQTLATAVAQRKKITLMERAKLQALSGQVMVLRDSVARNARGCYSYQESLRDDLEDQVFRNTAACDALFDFTNSALLSVDKISVAPSAVFLTAATPIDQAFELYDAAHAVATKLTEQEAAKAEREFWIAAGSIGIGLLLSIGLAAFTARRVTRQVYAITEVFDRVEEGDYEARTPVLTGDELGRMATSLNHMLDATVILIQSREERDLIQTAVVRLLDEVHDVAAGDLTREAKVGSDVTGPIAVAFNHMTQQLRQVIRQVQETTQQVTVSAGQVRSMTDQLDKGCAIQAAQIAQASNAIGGMTTSLQKVSQNALACVGVAQQSLANARQGSEAVRKTTTAMNRLRDRVSETLREIQPSRDDAPDVDAIVKTMDETAEWAGILALNSSLQASVAGNGGQRYTVIAEAAERLASRASDAARKMAHLPNHSRDLVRAMASLDETAREVVDSSLVACQAGHTLLEIETVSHRLAEMIQDIATTAGRQAEGAKLLSRTMHISSEATKFTARSVREASQSVGNLTELADALRGSVSKFRVPEPGEALHSVLVDHQDNGVLSVGAWEDDG